MKKPFKQYWTLVQETVFSRHTNKIDAIEAARKYAQTCDIAPEVIEVKSIGKPYRDKK